MIKRKSLHVQHSGTMARWGARARSGWSRSGLRNGAGAIAVIAAVLAASYAMADREARQDAETRAEGILQRGPSGLPLPRYVSLKADRVNVRGGPTADHDVEWVFVKAGLPVEIIAEYENWRRIRDSEGAEGWVYHALLTGRRTAIVVPWDEGARTDMRRRPDDAAQVSAIVEAGVLVSVRECDGTWCDVDAGNIRGYLRQDRLWGVYPEERVE